MKEYAPVPRKEPGLAIFQGYCHNAHNQAGLSNGTDNIENEAAVFESVEDEGPC